MNNNASVSMQAAEDTTPNRWFAVAEKGYFFTAPPTVKKRDLLRVLCGGETPYMMRWPAEASTINSLAKCKRVS
ncbi:uncharacterized protein BCR38DRAFT_445876 [Pseudomassariella vexata]|uniref:Uncharacterized protein n=1 Tax=Pseudomassariella vexata TaxID=1141098 RepID=A0A1Y2DIY7_9PEZI|nr:uncharacterized protein BCR38DRAFT_445876 [Pseudomassariella vexata]ORY59191.1 hypothetical protein BCR38DRAFT_445876 [Pseudomassariella vexata]